MFWPAQEKVAFGLIALLVAAAQVVLLALAAGNGVRPGGGWLVAVLVDCAVLAALGRYAQWAWKTRSRGRGLAIAAAFLLAFCVPALAALLAVRLAGG